MERRAVSSTFRLFRVKERSEDFGQYSTVRFLIHINVASSVLDPVTFFREAVPMSNGSGRSGGSKTYGSYRSRCGTDALKLFSVVYLDQD
jgi:hypothetical protein